jgi:hypothetical protein
MRVVGGLLMRWRRLRWEGDKREERREKRGDKREERREGKEESRGEGG